MAMITFRQGERVQTRHGEYEVLDGGDYRLTLEDGRTGRLPGDDVLEIREGKTMRAHCFHCWSDCEWRALDGSERRLCYGCVPEQVGWVNVRKLEDDETWDKGMRDG